MSTWGATQYTKLCLEPVAVGLRKGPSGKRPGHKAPPRRHELGCLRGMSDLFCLYVCLNLQKLLAEVNYLISRSLLFFVGDIAMIFLRPKSSFEK